MNEYNTKLLTARNARKQPKNEYTEIIVIAGSEAEPYKKGSVEYELILDRLQLENRSHFTPVWIGKQELEQLPKVQITEGENKFISVFQMGELTETQKTAICHSVALYTKAEQLFFYDLAGTRQDNSGYLERVRRGEIDENIIQLINENKKAPKKQVRDYDDGINKGLHLFETKQKGEDTQTTRSWLCNPLDVLGVGVDETGEHYTILKWRARSNNSEQLEAIPDQILGENEGWKLLRGKGLVVSPNSTAKQELAGYLLQESTKKGCWKIALKTGWQNNAYILPNGEILADTETNILLKDKSASTKGYTTNGTIESWQDNLARYAKGNAIFTLALACGFAAPLLHLLKADSFGVHIYGKSTGGKTTAGNLASSIWGYCDEMRLTWNSTKLGIINEALAHNDNLLPMDEITTADPTQLQSVSYDLFSGVGKLQGQEKGGNRAIKRWNILVFSTGEKDLETILRSANTNNNRKIEAKAGELVRFLNIPMQPAENWHEFTTAKDFADNINDQCKKHFGLVGREWIDFISKNTALLISEAEKNAEQWGLYLKELGDITSQTNRVAKRFSILETALQLSKHLTGLTEQEIKKALKITFNLWLENFGRGDKEDEQIINAISDYISHNYPKFTRKGIQTNNEFIGAIQELETEVNNEKREVFYITPSIFEDVIIKNFNRLETIKMLHKKGILKKTERDRFVSKIPLGIAPQKNARGYLIQNIFDDENE